MSREEHIREIFEIGAIAHTQDNLDIFSGMDDDELKSFLESGRKAQQTIRALIEKAELYKGVTPKL